MPKVWNPSATPLGIANSAYSGGVTAVNKGKKLLNYFPKVNLTATATGNTPRFINKIDNTFSSLLSGNAFGQTRLNELNKIRASVKGLFDSTKQFKRFKPTKFVPSTGQFSGLVNPMFRAGNKLKNINLMGNTTNTAFNTYGRGIKGIQNLASTTYNAGKFTGSGLAAYNSGKFAYNVGSGNEDFSSKGFGNFLGNTIDSYYGNLSMGKDLVKVGGKFAKGDVAGGLNSGMNLLKWTKPFKQTVSLVRDYFGGDK